MKRESPKPVRCTPRSERPKYQAPAERSECKPLYRFKDMKHDRKGGRK